MKTFSFDRNLLIPTLLLCVFAAPFAAAQDEEPAPTARSLTLEGLNLLDRGKAEDAYRVFHNGMVSFPEDLKLLICAGRAALAAGYTDKAVEHLFQAVDRDEKSYDANFHLGLALFAQGQVVASDLMTESEGYMMIEDALGFLRKAGEINLIKPDPYLELSKVYDFLGDVEAGAEAVHEAVKRAPDRTDVKILEADTAYKVFRNAGATGTPANEVRKLQKKAADLYAALREAHPELADAHMGLAALFEADRKWDEAAKAYIEALGRDPERIQAYNRLVAVFTLRDQKTKGEDDAAESEVEGVGTEPETETGTEEPPTLAEALAEVLDQVEKRFPGKEQRLATPLYYLGYARFHGGDLEACIQDFKRSAKLNPAYRTASYYHVLRASADLSEHDRAVKILLNMIKSDPEGLTYFMQNDRDFYAKTYPSFSFLAYNMVNQGRLDDARKINAQLLRVVENDASLYNNYAFTCRETKHYEDSYNAYEKALELDPTNPSYLNDAALILHYHLHRDLDKAEALYTKAREEAQRQLNDKSTSAFDLDAARTALRDATNNLGLLKRGVMRERQEQGQDQGGGQDK